MLLLFIGGVATSVAGTATAYIEASAFSAVAEVVEQDAAADFDKARNGATATVQ